MGAARDAARLNTGYGATNSVPAWPATASSSDPLNLRRHAARAEVPLREVALRFVDRHAVERTLVRLPEILATPPATQPSPSEP